MFVMGYRLYYFLNMTKTRQTQHNAHVKIIIDIWRLWHDMWQVLCEVE